MDLQVALEHRTAVEAFRRKHRTGLLTLLFTDIVGSTKLKQALGDREGVALIQHHHALLREILGQFNEGQEISTAGDSFFIVFVKPSDAVRFALLLQAQLRTLALARSSSRREEAHSEKSEIRNQKSEMEVRLPTSAATAIQDRIGIHIGEVVIEEREGAAKPRDLYGVQVDTCARVMSLAAGDQILLTRSAFDNARQVLKGEELQGLKALQWLNHGPYVVKGLEEPLEICEVGEAGLAHLKAPADAQKAQRKVSADEEPVLGWRPALDQLVPNTQWVLEKKLGEGGFGEVWLGQHQRLKERRVFKFCFRADRVRSLKREMTLFRVLKERVGDHPNIVRLLEVYFEEPPFYVVMDHVEGQDLKAWCEQQGGVEKVPLEARLEIVAQIADALQAAHDAGVIHRDVKPGNILVSNPKSEIRNQKSEGSQPSTLNPQPSAKLTDFGIGQVVSEEALKGVTKAGFTETLVASSSSSQTGSQMYMAPELLAGKPASTRSDIYSLGVVLYQLLVGDLTRPLTTDWADHIGDPLLRDDLKHCFSGNPQDRFAGAGQLAKNLRSFPERRAALVEQQTELAVREKAAYRRGLVRATLLASLVVAVIGLLGYLAFRLAGERQKALIESRRLLYASDLNVALQAWEGGNLSRARLLLREHRRLPGQEDLRGFEWRYLWQLCQGDELKTFAGHASSVHSVAFSPDGKGLITGSRDKTVKVWDVASRQESATLTGRSAEDDFLAFSPDLKLLATRVATNTVKVWDMNLGSVTATLTGHSGPVWSAAFSFDGKKLASSSADNTVKLWDLSSQSQEASLPESNIVTHLAFSPDTKRLAAYADGQVRVSLWDIARRERVLEQEVHNVYVSSMTFSPDGKMLATASYDNTVKLWNILPNRGRITLEQRASLPQGAPVACVAFSPDGQKLATGSYDNLVRLWDVESRQLLNTLRGHAAMVVAAAFSSDGKLLVTGSEDKTAKLWDATLRSDQINRLKQRGWVNSLAFSSNGNILATSDGNYQTVRLWNVPERREIVSFKDDTISAWCVALSPDGKILAAGAGVATVKLWDVVSERELTPLEGHKTRVSAIAFSPDGRSLVTGGDTLKLWEVDSWSESAPFPTNAANIAAVAFSPDGTLLGSASWDRTLKVWDVALRRELVSFSGRGQVRSVAFSPDGKTLAAASSDATVRLYDIANRRERAPLRGHLAWVNSVAFSPDGKTLATGSWDSTVKLWNLTVMQEVATLRGHLSPVAAVAFSPDGNTLASASGDATVRFWPAASFERIEQEENAEAKAK